jgi:integrase
MRFTYQEVLIMSAKKINLDKYLTEEEIKRLLDLIDDVEDKTLILFALETGLRRSEIVSIQTANIDYERQVLQVYDQKKDQWRSVVFPRYVGSYLKMYLRARQRRSPLLFPFSARTANRKLKRWCQTADIRLDAHGQTMVSFHWLRHTFIRRSKMAGRNIKVVQQNTGDTVETILKYYRDLSIEDRARELDERPIISHEPLSSSLQNMSHRGSYNEDSI